jgi:hypothetical protein
VLLKGLVYLSSLSKRDGSPDLLRLQAMREKEFNTGNGCRASIIFHSQRSHHLLRTQTMAEFVSATVLPVKPDSLVPRKCNLKRNNCRTKACAFVERHLV